MTVSATTGSLCPHCLRRIPAGRVLRDGAVYLEKSCPEHGRIDSVLLWKNEPWTFEEWSRPKAEKPGSTEPADCPASCGICRNHQQETCTAILEVTHRCELACPICFAASGSDTGKDPDLAQISEMLQAVKDHTGACPLQISGGEPVMRNDLPRIVALARGMGFDHIQLNTNGLRLSADADFAQSLRDAGVTDVFLQFDGLTDEAYLRIRGAPLLPQKLNAVERCAELKMGVILVPTLVRNVNESQIGAIIAFAKQWIPTVKGVHFQPMTFVGRYPSSPHNEERILIPEILRCIEEQTGGELLVENMLPSG